VGNPAMHPAMAIPTWLGALPGMSAMCTMMMKREMEKLDIPPVGEFIEMISDAGGEIYGCKAACDMFKLTRDDLCPQVQEILTVGDFYEKSAGAQIIFT
jgi:peroxiredoxin family protein